MVEPPHVEDVFVCCTRFLRMYIHLPDSDSDFGAQAAGLLLALSHWRACQQQALRDPRSILVGEW